MANGVLFQEAIDAFRERLELGVDEWDELVAAADRSATARSTRMTEALIADISKAVLEAIEAGSSIETFRGTFEELITRRGWEATSDKAWHSDLVFRRLTAEAAAAGRWRQAQRLKRSRPYLRYVTAGDARVREAHRQWQDVILPVDDPWWRTHMPPNGWNCRCHVQSLSARDLERYGLEVSAEAPPIELVTKKVRDGDGYRLVEVPAGIDPGFAVNVGEKGS